VPSSTAIPLTQALQKHPSLRSLPAGGTIVSTASHTSWWVQFTQAPPVSTMTLLARIGVGWGYSATRSFATGADSRLNPSTMTNAELMRAGLPLPPAATDSSAYTTWLNDVRSLLPRLHYQNSRPAPVALPGRAWYTSTATMANWAGYVDTQATYSGIQAQFHMASTAYTLPYGQGIAQWVGLGGDTMLGANTGLAQAGASRMNVGQSNGYYQSTLFIESLSSSNGVCYKYTTGGFAPGDDIWSQVNYIGALTLNGTSYSKYKAIALDGGNGDSTGWQYFDCPGTYVNNSADAITETPQVTPSSGPSFFTTLPPYSPAAPFFNVYTYTGGNEVNGEVAPYQLLELRNNTDPYGASNATPTGWSSQTAFAVNYGTSP